VKFAKENAPASAASPSRNPREDIRMDASQSATSQISDDREKRIQALIEQLRPDAESALRHMAEHLVDLPEEKSFGQIEYDLRDEAHRLACSAHQAGLAAGKKRATKAPASPARTAEQTPDSSNTGPRPG
jgi:hypothetical protein